MLKKAKKVFGKKDTPDSPRVAAKRNKMSQDVQIWDFDEQMQPRRPDTASAVPSQSGAGHAAQQIPQQDDWFTTAMQQSAQLSELARKDETQDEQQSEQELISNGQRRSKNRLRRRAAAAADEKPPNDDWFKAAMEQSAQLDALKQPQTV